MRSEQATDCGMLSAGSQSIRAWVKYSAVWQELKTAGPFRSLLAFTVGVLVPILGYLFIPASRTGTSVLDKGILPSGGPWLARLLLGFFRWFIKIYSWPWIVAVFALFAVLAIRWHKRKEGWVSSWLAGTFFILMLHQIIMRM